MRQIKITQQITLRESLSLNKYLQEISSIPLLTLDEEIDLANRIKQGDEAALKRFIEGNLRFVISVSKQYQGSGEKLEDLINAGNEGLMIAAKRFDSSRGFKFISYAVWWIRQSIMLHLTENSKSIRLPANKITLINKIKNVSSKLEQTLQRMPTTEEISDEMLANFDTIKEKITADEIDAINYVSSPISSLDMKLGEDSESTLADLIKSDGLMDINETLKQEDLQLTLKKVLDKRLSHRERDVVIASFGLFGIKQQTLEEIGMTFDLTRERVRQIKEKAIRKLKSQHSSKEIREYI